MMLYSTRHQMETFSALLAICAENSTVTGEFPTQRPVTRSFDAFFALRLNKREADDLRRHRAHYDCHSNGKSYGKCKMTWWDINTHIYRIQYTISCDNPRTLLRPLTHFEGPFNPFNRCELEKSFGAVRLSIEFNLISDGNIHMDPKLDVPESAYALSHHSAKPSVNTVLTTKSDMYWKLLDYFVSNSIKEQLIGQWNYVSYYL